MATEGQTWSFDHWRSDMAIGGRTWPLEIGHGRWRSDMATGGREWPLEVGHRHWRDNGKISDKEKATMKEDDDGGK